MLFSSCQKNDEGSYVAPIKLTEKIGGNYVLNSIVQTDEIAGTEMILTSLLDFDTFGISLSQDGKFSVSGNAPKLLPESGEWQLDNDFVKSTGEASKIILKGDKTVSLTVTSVPGAKQELEFQLTRTQNGQPFVSYKYNLVSVE